MSGMTTPSCDNPSQIATNSGRFSISNATLSPCLNPCWWKTFATRFLRSSILKERKSNWCLMMTCDCFFNLPLWRSTHGPQIPGKLCWDASSLAVQTSRWLRHSVFSFFWHAVEVQWSASKPYDVKEVVNAKTNLLSDNRFHQWSNSFLMQACVCSYLSISSLAALAYIRPKCKFWSVCVWRHRS